MNNCYFDRDIISVYPFDSENIQEVICEQWSEIEKVKKAQGVSHEDNYNTLDKKIDANTTLINENKKEIDKLKPKVDTLSPKVEQNIKNIAVNHNLITDITPKVEKNIQNINALTPKIDKNTNEIDTHTQEINAHTLQITKNEAEIEKLQKPKIKVHSENNRTIDVSGGESIVYIPNGTGLDYIENINQGQTPIPGRMVYIVTESTSLQIKNGVGFMIHGGGSTQYPLKQRRIYSCIYIDSSGSGRWYIDATFS